MRGARPRTRALVGLAVGFAGLILLVRPGGGGGLDPWGVGALLIASLAWAAGSIYSSRAVVPSSPLLMTAMQMTAGGLLLLALSGATGEPARFVLSQVSGRSLLAFAYLIVFGALVGFTAYSWLLRVAPPVLVSTYAYVNPVVAVVLGWALLGEPLTTGTLVAAAVILAGVVLITTAKAEEPAAAPAALATESRPDDRLERKACA